MRRDLFIGLFVALAFHVGVAWIGEIVGHPQVVAKAKVEEKVIEIKMHEIEPDPPDPEEQDQEAPPDIPPPMQTDVPQIITDTSFVQQLEPPPPPDVKPVRGIITIPKGEHNFNGVKVFNIADLDQVPDAKWRQKPIYPADMMAQHISGTVIVDFLVDTNGDVQNVYAKSSTRREFESSAISAVRKWKFHQGRKNGHPVVFKMEVPIEYSPPSDSE
jgi:protein TonB